MQDWTPREHYTAEDLVEIIRILRDRDTGCPWDKVQTHASIRKNFLEETCEALEAIDADDADMLREELGDVLFAAVKVGRFAGVDPEDALNVACEKFIRRYAAVEQGAAGRGVPVSDLTLAEMTDLWNGAKQRHDSDGF